MPELRAELEARGLETKGVKSLLCKRLQEALDQEKEKDEGEGAAPTGDIEMTDVAGDEEEAEKKEEVYQFFHQHTCLAANVSVFEEPTLENREKAEAEQKKLAEEQKKKAEKLEKEKQEKKTALEKHYAMPKERKVCILGRS